MSDAVIINIHEDINLVEVIINRPEKKNALTQAMYQQLLNALTIA